MNHRAIASQLCLALVLAATAGTALAGPDGEAVCGGSSTTCLEQVSQALAGRGANSPAPRPRRVPRAAEPPVPAPTPHLNMDQTLSNPA
jgi:hypothetical protein